MVEQLFATNRVNNTSVILNNDYTDCVSGKNEPDT